MANQCNRCKRLFHEHSEEIWIDHLKECNPEHYAIAKPAYEKRKNRMPEMWE
jgi:hypothetical protein